MQEDIDRLQEEKRDLDEEVHTLAFKLEGFDPEEFSAMKETYRTKTK
jgi:cell division septum initiation protein DivIVA